MSNSKENDVFEDAKNLVGCSYISNLPYYKYILVHKMKRLDTSKYDKKQLEDFSVYVFGLPYEILHSMGGDVICGFLIWQQYIIICPLER